MTMVGIRLISLVILLSLSVVITEAKFGLFFDIMKEIALSGPTFKDDGSDGMPIDREHKYATGECALLEGCTSSTARKCFENDACTNCYHGINPVNERNVMRADFYDFDEDEIRKCFDINNSEADCYRASPDDKHQSLSRQIGDMFDTMLLKGTSVADRFQGAVFQRINVPELMNLKDSYEKTFCDESCVAELRKGCIQIGTLKNAREWCLTALDWISDEIPNMSGPSSYVLMLAAKITEGVRMPRVRFQTPNAECEDDTATEKCVNKFVPNSVTQLDGLEGVLVAAACTSAMLTSNWFQHFTYGIGNQKEFGFAVQHSLWLAILSGRLGISLQAQDEFPLYEEIGDKILCTVQEAENHEMETGSVYASLCSLKNHNHKLVFRPEILSPNSIGCMEKTTGMAFIRPGDWVRPGSKSLSSPNERDCIGGGLLKFGYPFIDPVMVTTVEITKNGINLFPPSIGQSLRSAVKATCQDPIASVPSSSTSAGKLGNGFLGKCGLNGIGSICGWHPVW